MFSNKKKPSLFERLTGTVRYEDADFYEEDNEDVRDVSATQEKYEEELPTEETDGELAVDVYETGNTIVIKAITAGVRKEGLDINLTRNSLTIRGVREDRNTPDHEDYITQELYWGSFSRTIRLPEEVEIEEASADEHHGLLTITLPKIDRNRAMKVKVQ
jgi:HSP20 family protein